jgi:hypothetical protein
VGDGCAALDWDPDLRQVALLMKRFDQKVFTRTPEKKKTEQIALDKMTVD